MESNWRWDREVYAPGGFMGYNPDWFADPQLRFFAKLIPPLPVIGGVTMTHIGVGPRVAGGQRYWLGIITPVGVYPAHFQWKDSNIDHSASQRFPIPGFPVEAD